MFMKDLYRAKNNPAFAARLGLCAGLLLGFSAVADDTPAATQTPAPGETPAATPEPAPVAPAPAAATNPAAGTSTNSAAAAKWLYVNPGVAPKTNAAPRWKQVKTSVQTKVLAVNRPDNSFTIENDGKIHRLKVQYGVYIFRKGRVTTLDYVVAGNNVNLDLIEWAPGRYDLLTATILPNKLETQPATVASTSSAERKLQREQAKQAEEEREQAERAQKQQA